MKVLSYLILFIILVICLSMNNYVKKEKFGDVDLPGKPEITLVEHIEPDSVKIIWKKPTTPVGFPITGYMIMLKKSDNSSKGVYLNFKTDNVDCVNCEYTITNIPLISKTYYTIGVLAINSNGSGLPGKSEFQTKNTTTIMPTPSSPPSSSSSSVSSLSASSSLDPYLDNMISRADGIYSFNKGVLEYPDTFEKDAKDSVSTLNEEVIKELQEGRINIHIGMV
jgi:hypothetical protein